MVKKLFYCIIFIMIIFAGIYAAKQISKKEETVKTTSTKTTNTVNKIEEGNKTVENVEEKTEEENKTEENNVSEDENKEEKAKQIVKQNWGEDDSVYYSYDGIDKNGRYIICVREKTTTKALFWYYVDIESGTFDIE